MDKKIKKVLVIEGDEQTRKGWVDELKRYDLLLVYASSSEEADKQLNENRDFAAIIICVNDLMYDTDGTYLREHHYGIVSMARSHRSRTFKKPIIAASNYHWAAPGGDFTCSTQDLPTILLDAMAIWYGATGNLWHVITGNS